MLLNQLAQDGEDELSGKLRIKAQFRILKSGVPREPKINKNGAVSAAAITTLKSKYAEALRASGQTPTEKQINRLESLSDEWSTIVEYNVTTQAINDWQQRVQAYETLMHEARRDDWRRVKNLSNCWQCGKKDLCHTGFDVRYKQNHKG